MYQQPNHSYTSTDSIRRFSSNNPFRPPPTSSAAGGAGLGESGFGGGSDRVSSDSSTGNLTGNRISSNSSNGSINLVRSPNSKNFDSWVAKNKQLVQDESLEEDDNYNNYLLLDEYTNSNEPSPVETDFAPPQKPKSVRTNSDSSVKMSSNNPFASAFNGSYVHHRDPPPVPSLGNNYKSSTPPSRPPKSGVPPPPPSYEEAAGPEATRREYPREKSSSSSSGSSRPRRSHSDGDPGRRSHRSRSDRHERSEKSDKDKHYARRSSHHRSSKRSKEPEAVKAKNLDTIDKLDVTGFFGGGFHHDGPFDACTPHRNKNSKVAPVMAFPVDGPNSSVKGQQNVNTDDQMNLAFGNYSDQNEIVGRKFSIKQKLTSKSSDDVLNKPTTDVHGSSANGNSFNNQVQQSLYNAKENASVVNFDAHVKSEPVHGIQTAGLGSSTFLDGAPAPKGDDNLNLSNGGLGRKKSLVQRLRKNSGSELGTRRSSNDHSMRSHSGSGSGGAHSNSTDELNSSNSLDVAPEGNSLIRRVKSLKVGRRER